MINHWQSKILLRLIRIIIYIHRSIVNVALEVLILSQYKASINWNSLQTTVRSTLPEQTWPSTITFCRMCRTIWVIYCATTTLTLYKPANMLTFSHKYSHIRELAYPLVPKHTLWYNYYIYACKWYTWYIHIQSSSIVVLSFSIIILIRKVCNFLCWIPRQLAV